MKDCKYDMATNTHRRLTSKKAAAGQHNHRPLVHRTPANQMKFESENIGVGDADQESGAFGNLSMGSGGIAKPRGLTSKKFKQAKPPVSARLPRQ